MTDIDKQLEETWKKLLGCGEEQAYLWFQDLLHQIYTQAKAEQREIDALIAENYVKQWKFPKDSNAKIHYTTVGNEIATAIRED